MFKTLHTFNFGEIFIQYVKTMYNNIEAIILNNRNTNHFFTSQVGVQQGYSFSAYLIITALENLAIKIRNDTSFTGIKIDNKELNISLLAADITMLLNYLNSVRISIVILKMLHQCKQYKLNMYALLKMRTTFPMDQDAHRDTRHHHYRQLVTKLQILLSKLNHQPQKNTQYLETEKTITKREITLVNSLTLALLTYTSSVVDTPPKTIQHFLWDDSISKISQHTLIRNIENGGLKLCHIEIKVKALRLSWLKYITSETQSNYKILFRVFYKCSNVQTYFDANHKLLHTNTIPSF